jgi:hypothetical protein
MVLLLLALLVVRYLVLKSAAAASTASCAVVHVLLCDTLPEQIEREKDKRNAGTVIRCDRLAVFVHVRVAITACS